MSTETTNKKIKIDNGTTFGRTYTDKAVDELLKNAGGGGIPTANISSETFQLDTSSLTAKDQYVLASMDGGEGNISYVPLQTYFFNDGYFNKEVKLQISNHDFRLSLASASFQSYNNYTLNAEATNVDFTNTLDSTNTWTKLGDIKYIAIEERNALTEESSHKYLEINSLPALPADASSKNYALNSVNGKLTWNTIGKGLEIRNGALISNLFNFKYGTLRLKNITSNANSYDIELSFFDYIYDVIINGTNQLMGTSLTRDTFPSFLKNNITQQLFITLITNIIDVHRKAALMPYFDVTIIEQNNNSILTNCSTAVEGGVGFFCGTNEINLPNPTFGDTFTVEYYGSWYGD